MGGEDEHEVVSPGGNGDRAHYQVGTQERGALAIERGGPAGIELFEKDHEAWCLALARRFHARVGKCSEPTDSRILLAGPCKRDIGGDRGAKMILLPAITSGANRASCATLSGATVAASVQ